jgi:CheY-like chemotaxis protein/HPt (histidine-containing phosphotransfer) domain-containing protein
MEEPKRIRILIAEDNEANRMLAIEQLKRLGFAGEAVATGAEAVSAVAREVPRLVLMDCHMPLMDGFAATAAIREAERGSERHTIVVAMTASATASDREACLAAGMDDYLSKPVMMADLDRTLARWLPEHAASLGEPVRAAAGPTGGPLDRSIIDRLRRDLRSEESFTALIKVYMDELPRRVSGLTSAAEAADGNGVRSAAHTMKSTSAMVGAATLSRLCTEIEAEADGPGPVAVELAHEIAREAETVLRELESLLANPAA